MGDLEFSLAADKRGNRCNVLQRFALSSPLQVTNVWTAAALLAKNRKTLGAGYRQYQMQLPPHGCTKRKGRLSYLRVVGPGANDGVELKHRCGRLLALRPLLPLVVIITRLAVFLLGRGSAVFGGQVAQLQLPPNKSEKESNSGGRRMPCLTDLVPGRRGIVFNRC